MKVLDRKNIEINPLQTTYGEYIRKINNALNSELELCSESEFKEPLKYALNGGKRIRPIILLLAAECVGKIDENTLEKILLDFGVEGKIKKVSRGPVVTLNEFEPAAGIKVSKIINLSEDIARNTSSESARISTIPGSSTIGIELPNSSRENVYLSEIISSSNFIKKDII